MLAILKYFLAVSIFSLIDSPERYIIKDLETLIFEGVIDGEIDIRSTSLKLISGETKLICGLCKGEFPREEFFQCNECNHLICRNCNSEMRTAGFTSCPECGGNLSQVIKQ